MLVFVLCRRCSVVGSILAVVMGVRGGGDLRIMCEIGMMFEGGLLGVSF